MINNVITVTVEYRMPSVKTGQQILQLLWKYTNCGTGGNTVRRTMLPAAAVNPDVETVVIKSHFFYSDIMTVESNHVANHMQITKQISLQFIYSLI